MISFRNDYGFGAHHSVLAHLAAINPYAHAGYGTDSRCAAAAESIRDMFHAPEADVHFIPGGTLANLTVIAAMLRPHQGAISADTGHINVHETGAVEATGHKVLAVPHACGKVAAADVARLVDVHRADEAMEHTVQPGMVYISNTTELGTVYTGNELSALSAVCRQYSLPLFLDGARLGYALAAEDAPAPEAIAAACDVFTVGGTKQGALFGEAVVITNPALQRDFRYALKQRGGMLAKGWLMGAQFEALLKDDLYLSLSHHANALAIHLRDALTEMGIPFASPSPSNQQFPVLPHGVINKLLNTYDFGIIERLADARSTVRFCTSWATRAEDVEALIGDIRALMHAR